ncbi:MAG: DUF4328 domain-containing protein [Caulobacteraceae bacterium]|nr:DUF4328 domain-containing protein [Caulobacteraceae bacterium]
MSDGATTGEAGPIFREISTAAPERRYRYSSLKRLTYAAVGLLGVKLLAAALQLPALGQRWSLIAQAASLSRAERSSMLGALRQSDAIVGVLASLFMVGVVASYVISAFWIYRAACNVRALGARGLQSSPGWAVGWYFVPVMCLFKPFTAMEEIWQASMAPAKWRLQRPPNLLRWWWASWLIVGFVGYIVLIIARSATNDIPGLIMSTQAQMIDYAIDCAATAIFLVVLLKIYRAQARTHASESQISEIFA